MSDSRARYTSEEAVNMVGNRFDLVLIASARVRELKRGYRPKVPKSNDGHTVTALKEIEKAMDRDTFLEADEAKAFGIVDEVFDKRPAASAEGEGKES